MEIIVDEESSDQVRKISKGTNLEEEFIYECMQVERKVFQGFH
jgi:hypothetical protein